MPASKLLIQPEWWVPNASKHRQGASFGFSCWPMVPQEILNTSKLQLKAIYCSQTLGSSTPLSIHFHSVRQLCTCDLHAVGGGHKILCLVGLPCQLFYLWQTNGVFAFSPIIFQASTKCEGGCSLLSQACARMVALPVLASPLHVLGVYGDRSIHVRGMLPSPLIISQCIRGTPGH